MDNIRKIKISTLLGLCYILDDYPKFKDNIIKVLKENKEQCSYKTIDQIATVIKNYQCSSEIRKIMNDNIDVIIKLQDISKDSMADLISGIYASYLGWNSLDIDFYYQYLIEHKNDFRKIELLLTHLLSIGIDYIELDENADFTRDEYTMDVDSNKQQMIVYMDNIKIIPNSQEEFIKYKSTHSNYSIIFFRADSYHRDLNVYPLGILVNSLTFDISRLPDRITWDSFFEVIIKKNEESKCDNYITELSGQLEDLSNRIDRIYIVINDNNHEIDRNLMLEELLEIKRCADDVRERCSVIANKSSSQEDVKKIY